MYQKSISVLTFIFCQENVFIRLKYSLHPVEECGWAMGNSAGVKGNEFFFFPSYTSSYYLFPYSLSPEQQDTQLFTTMYRAALSRLLPSVKFDLSLFTINGTV